MDSIHLTGLEFLESLQTAQKEFLWSKLLPLDPLMDEQGQWTRWTPKVIKEVCAAISSFFHMVIWQGSTRVQQASVYLILDTLDPYVLIKAPPGSRFYKNRLNSTEEVKIYMDEVSIWLAGYGPLTKNQFLSAWRIIAPMLPEARGCLDRLGFCMIMGGPYPYQIEFRETCPRNHPNAFISE